MNTVNSQTTGSQFIHALFIDKNFNLANSFCEFPVTFTFENLTQEIYDTREFELFFARFDKHAFKQINILSEKTLFQENAISTLFMELDFPHASFSAMIHLTLCNEKIRSCHFLTAEECECAELPEKTKKAQKRFPFKKLYYSALHSLDFLLKNKDSENASQKCLPAPLHSS